MVEVTQADSISFHDAPIAGNAHSLAICAVIVLLILATAYFFARLLLALSLMNLINSDIVFIILIHFAEASCSW